MRYMHVYRARLSVKIEAPHQIEQFFAAEDNTLVLSQNHKQVEFLGTQVDLRVACMNTAARRVNCDIANVDRSGLFGSARFGATQYSLDPCHHFTRVKRLSHVVV